MFKRGDTVTPDSHSIRARRPLIRIGRVLAVLWVVVSLVVAGLRLAGGSSLQIFDLMTIQPVFGIWDALAALDVLLALAAIFGAGIALVRRNLLLGLLFSLLTWPVAFIIEANRCYHSACRTVAWAALPPSVGDWSIRIRPVAESKDAEAIASQALFQAGSPYSAYNAKLFGGYWIVPTINDDGWPGPHAVRVETRTGATHFVPCPADRIPCGMERPVLSGSGQVFSNARWGLSMTFPAGQAVCTARPEDDKRRDEAQGFYAMVRDGDIPCDIVDPSRSLGLEAVTEPAVAKAYLQRCKPISPVVLGAFGNTAPAFAGHHGIVCEEVAEGQIAVSVFAYAQPPSDTGEPTTLYGAWMLTDPIHLAEDAGSFEAFLKTARIPKMSH